MGLTLAAATALSAGLNFLGGLGTNQMNAQFNAEEAQKNRDFQKEMYERQYEDNIKFWNMQNEYNLPSAQLARLREAGLNPLLAYGEGSLSGNIASQAPQSAQAPNGAQASVNMRNPVDMANLAMLEAQIENIKADTANKKEETFGKSIQNEVDWRTRDAKVAIQNKNVQFLDQQIEWLATQDFALTNITAANLADIASMIEYRQKYYDLDEARVANQMWYNIEQIAIGKAHVSNELKQIAVNWYNAATDRLRVQGELKVFAAQVNEINSRKDLTDAQKAHEYVKAYNTLLKNFNLEVSGSEQLSGTAAAIIFGSGSLSGRASDISKKPVYSGLE